MTWSTTSPRSTSTHSASRSHSTRSGCQSSFLAWRTTSAAIALTCRLEVPEATTMKSQTLVLPWTSISTTSLPLRSASAARTVSTRASADGGGSGRRVLMTCAVLVKWAWLWVRCVRSEEHTSELQSIMRTSYDVFCLTKKNTQERTKQYIS